MKEFFMTASRIGEVSKLVATKKTSAPTKGYNSDQKLSDKDIPTQGSDQNGGVTQPTVLCARGLHCR